MCTWCRFLFRKREGIRPLPHFFQVILKSISPELSNFEFQIIQLYKNE